MPGGFFTQCPDALPVDRFRIRSFGYHERQCPGDDKHRHRQFVCTDNTKSTITSPCQAKRELPGDGTSRFSGTGTTQLVTTSVARILPTREQWTERSAGDRQQRLSLLLSVGFSPDLLEYIVDFRAAGGSSGVLRGHHGRSPSPAISQRGASRSLPRSASPTSYTVTVNIPARRIHGLRIRTPSATSATLWHSRRHATARFPPLPRGGVHDRGHLWELTGLDG